MLKKIREMYNKSRFSRNTMPKILSLVFALVFWIYVMDNVNPEMTKDMMDVPVELIGVEQLEANGYEIMGERDFLVDVELSGRRNELLKIAKSDLHITADLGTLSNGVQAVSLKQYLGADEVVINQLSKDTITIDIDEIIRIPIDVKIIKQGTLPDGYVEELMELSVQQIFVQGPESYVNTVDSIRGAISINNEISEINKDIAVEAVDKNGETVTGIQVETNYVSVLIPISKSDDIMLEPLLEGSVASGYEITSISVTPSHVNVRGEREVVNDLKLIATQGITVSGLRESFEISTSLNLPENIVLNQYLDDVTVEVTIEEIITKEFTYDYSDITFINKDSNFRTNINELEGQVLLRVSAVESIANELTKNDLGLYIDAENFEVGIMVMDIELNRSSEFNSVEIIPETFELEISDVNDIIDEEIPTEPE